MKKNLNNLLNVTLCISMIFGLFSPLRVLAVGDLVYNITASDEWTIAKNGNVDEIQATKGTAHAMISFRTSDDNQIDDADIDVVCADTTHCTVTISNQSGVTIPYPKSEMSLSIIPNSGEPYLYNFEVLNHSENIDVADPKEDGPQSNFDGNATLVWSCGNKICYHQFTGLNQGERIIFQNASSIADDNDASIKFDVHAQTKFFASKERFDERKAEIDANSVKIEDLEGQGGINYRPVREPYENNAYVSYADRNFKAIIYNDKFKALKIGDLSELNYYPGAWENKLTRRESFDLSDTTKENPVEFDMVLLETKFNLQKIDINGFTIKSIEPLDVPEGTVTVTKKNDGSYDIDFASRFYNKVVFKLTDNNNKEYYFKINRQAMAVDMRLDNRAGEILSELYYDRMSSWDDYSVVAKILYKDGTSKLVELENAKHIDDGLGNTKDIEENDEENPARDEWPKGKGLKRAVFKKTFEIDELKKIDKIYLNVEFKGSSSTKYAGNYAGSGKGEVIDISDEEYQRRMN